jgi:hypothetical protein
MFFYHNLSPRFAYTRKQCKAWSKKGSNYSVLFAGGYVDFFDGQAFVSQGILFAISVSLFSLFFDIWIVICVFVLI